MNQSMQTMQTVFDEADCLFNEQQIDAAIHRMATEITRALSEKDPLVLCIMNGGLILAGQLLPRLPFPLQVDYMHATRYRMETSGADLDWRVAPEAALTGREVLIIDDILDEGKTLAEIIKYCQKKGAANVYTAVLVDKLHDRKAVKGFKADFSGLEAADRFLFGYGMDYKGYWRNAPGIYAVKGL
ncbi:MAG: hypoxanthine-guanine phosphoribosyltransferase [Hahellaceae bacterium]|jgi:hypoxanthine phosphoribosyltransferase|nr:hypoxanthine-guanine phosphoribosyltransferase [Hahellaceae bacterium]MCP5210737.1 hypoxanthine-guanine phosphoribosyltransferase [Hahellaceae bacterium]